MFGAWRERQQKRKDIALIHAVSTGDERAARRWLDAGADPDADHYSVIPQGGMAPQTLTPLLVAINGRWSSVTFLVMKAIEDKHRDTPGRIPLAGRAHLPLAAERYEAPPAGLIHWLLAKTTARLDDTLPGAEGNTALHLVSHPSTLEFLLRHGDARTLVNGKNNLGETPFTRALKYKDYLKAHVLGENGADIFSEESRACFLHCAETGDRQGVNVFLDTARRRDRLDALPLDLALFRAAGKGHADTVALLHKAGGRVDFRDPSSGRTPLLNLLSRWPAAPRIPPREEGRHESTLAYLLDNKADPLAQDDSGDTARDRAIRAGDLWAVRRIEAAIEDKPGNHLAVTFNLSAGRVTVEAAQGRLSCDTESFADRGLLRSVEAYAKTAQAGMKPAKG